MASHTLPEVVRIKRKRGDEESPLPYLRVDDARSGKRHLSDAYVYRRRTTAATVPLSEIQTPVGGFDSAAVGARGGVGASAPATTAGTSLTRESQIVTQPPSKPARTFRVVHPSQPVDDYELPGPAAARRRPRTQSTVFVEWAGSKGRTSPGEPSSVACNIASPGMAPIREKSSETPGITISEVPKPPALVSESKPTAITPLKRPGLAKRSASRTAPTSKDNSRGVSPANVMSARVPMLPGPSGLSKDSYDQLAAEMSAFALEVVAAEEADRKRAETARAAGAVSTEPAAAGAMALKRVPAPSKLKPKAPLRRYPERHPEQPVSEAPNAREAERGFNGDGDVEMDDAEEGDFVIETYVRVPVHEMRKGLAPDEVGLLLIQGDLDAELFYGEGTEDADDWDDDEDENDSEPEWQRLTRKVAEDHYTADYPEDEVSSDDEYDRLPYKYRTRNASDLEEYGSEDEAYSADEDGNGDGMRGRALGRRSIGVDNW